MSSETWRATLNRFEADYGRGETPGGPPPGGVEGKSRRVGRTRYFKPFTSHCTAKICTRNILSVSHDNNYLIHYCHKAWLTSYLAQKHYLRQESVTEHWPFERNSSRRKICAFNR